MTKIVGIYKIENLINHKCYIGQSKNIEKRWNKHRNAYKNIKDKAYNYPLSKAIRKYGINNFSFEIIEECKVKELNKKEKFYIKKYDSYFNGYNQTLGGNTSSCVEKEKIIGVINDLKNTDMFHKEIAEKWNISIEMVQGINTGRHWKCDENYPLQKQHKPQIVIRNGKQIICNGASKVANYCIDCGKQITYSCLRCEECNKRNRRKVERPTKEELYNLLKEHKNFLKIGKMFGVTDNAVRKWCKYYHLPHKTNDYIEPKLKIKKKEKLSKRKVLMIDIKTNKILNSFNSIVEAEEFIGAKKGSTIYRLSKEDEVIAYGYKWKNAST